MENTPLPEQGRYGTTGYPPTDMAWCYPDPNANLDVLILVASPMDPNNFHPRDLHWSLSWEVQRGIWRHVNVLEHARDNQPPPNPRLVFWGPMTKMGGGGTLEARKVHLATLSLAARKRLEQLAWTVPVMYPNGRWNCQDWLLDLLARMRNEGLITEQQMQNAVRAARNAWRTN
ncbi:hypothetical protein PYCCODRAFT_329616 [Trametes coccinea BRFM310]|uniref:Uncharacterized protein n=1 Tax=Trametes coccinea (strain BRFM310) TaxID=1353009 RepID=A0A1Y2IQZ2_TRAC3|nr:hypothetical protein PYCCODRAFT_329616 [Trametes coccinea BRFM310]